MLLITLRRKSWTNSWGHCDCSGTGMETCSSPNFRHRRKNVKKKKNNKINKIATRLSNIHRGQRSTRKTGKWHKIPTLASANHSAHRLYSTSFNSIKLYFTAGTHQQRWSLCRSDTTASYCPPLLSASSRSVERCKHTHTHTFYQETMSVGLQLPAYICSGNFCCWARGEEPRNVSAPCCQLSISHWGTDSVLTVSEDTS